MKVIVAGFPKTGTKSMSAALTRLWYKVFDFRENVFLRRREYTKVFREGWTNDDFHKIYDGVDACIDMPVYLFWEEIHKAFPDAKVISLTNLEYCIRYLNGCCKYCRSFWPWEKMRTCGSTAFEIKRKSEVLQWSCSLYYRLQVAHFIESWWTISVRENERHMQFLFP